MEKSCKAAGMYVAWLRAMAMVHQHNHWTVKGKSFYGDHLLFQRLYESATTNVDTAAEKMIGLFGEECLDYTMQAELINKTLLKYKGNNPVEMSLAIEKDFINFSKETYQLFDDEDRLSLGLDDMIMAIASQREESVYLLQQMQKGIVSKSAKRMFELNKLVNSIRND